MTSEEELVLKEALRALQSKHAYFLLAAAGACIGFALTRTQDLSLSITQAPLLAAILMWGASFCAGCLQINRVQDGLAGRAGFLEFARTDTGVDDMTIDLIEEEVAKSADVQTREANRLSKLQFRFLVVGAISYTFWQFLEMLLRAAW
jgi:hypothetical protein